MKKLVKSLLIAGILLLWCAGSSWAFPVSAGMKVTMANDWNVPYTMTGPGFEFQTFCLESQKYFTPGNEYTVTSVGNIVQNQGDPLDDRTKWLYAAYMSGVVFDSSVTAEDVQRAIWSFEGEAGGYEGEWFATYYADATSRFDDSGWDVRAVNLTGDYYDAQSQLVGVAPVPEPATMLLFGTGLIGLAGLSRKKFIS